MNKPLTSGYLNIAKTVLSIPLKKEEKFRFIIGGTFDSKKQFCILCSPKQFDCTNLRAWNRKQTTVKSRSATEYITLPTLQLCLLESNRHEPADVSLI